MAASTATRTRKTAALAKPDRPIIYKDTLVTVQMAQGWLDTRKDGLNTRPVSKANINKWARDMERGEWLLNGETIKISVPTEKHPQGELLDGQHRFLAQVKANVSVMYTLAYNVPTVAMPTIGTGKAKTFGDVLKFRGVPYASACAGVSRRLYQWRNGHRYRPGGNATPSIAEMDAVWEHNQERISYCALRGQTLYQDTGFLAPVSGGLFLFLACEKDYDQANAFFDRLIDGKDTSDGSPIYALRRKLGRRDANEVFSDYERLAMVVNAWNFWRKEKPIQTIALVYSASGRPSTNPLINDNFPEIL
jgi:hypothetical protein